MIEAVKSAPVFRRCSSARSWPPSRSCCWPPIIASVASTSSRRDARVARERERERLGEERVAGEDRRRLAVGRPDARLAAPLGVVVERRQVVVDEREGVHELDRGRRRQRPLELAAGRLGGREAEHRPDALAAERVAQRLGERPEVGRRLELVEVALDELAQLVRRPRHPPRPRAGRSGARPRSAWRARRAPGAPRSPPPGLVASSRSRAASSRASSASAWSSDSSALLTRSPPPRAGCRPGCRSRASPPRRTRSAW